MSAPSEHANLADSYLKYKIAVSGAAITSHCSRDALQKAEALGQAIAHAGAVLVTGATTGVPYWAAKGAKMAGGIVIGISPAATRIHHIKTYKLPTDYHDLLIYTGFGYSGRNLLFTRSADAVITLCGRIGTLNEFTDAFEDGKVQGILTSDMNGTSSLIPKILEEAHRGVGGVIYDPDPRSLISQVMEALRANEKDLEKVVL
jgi:uncharacterized protein (TIGR00725 family)